MELLALLSYLESDASVKIKGKRSEQLFKGISWSTETFMGDIKSAVSEKNGIENQRDKNNTLIKS